MVSKQRSGPNRKSRPSDVETLYWQLLEQFYEHGNRRAARKIAERLERALAASPEVADSIRGEEIRSLLAEVHGDLAEAARSREAEIRKILQLQALAAHAPTWESVSRHYDFSDVSDRLDLLAILYEKQGDTDRAIATLFESRDYCQAHDISFDSQDLLDELQRSRRRKQGTTRAKRKQRVHRGPARKRPGGSASRAPSCCGPRRRARPR
jgi:hypothetical protein